ncbi:hypothetical protein BRC83_01255 [Halobacteriales archaeon QS_1_68_17]|nr:MAG: hypothetical protein BRC83_01255 [Halobacteriales archaeon QS_1_68_17]
MQVICTDGTVFECRAYEVIDAGVMLFGEEADDQPDRYAGGREQIGYVPHHQLHYIIPEDVAVGPPEPGPARQPSAPQAGGEPAQR